MIRLYLILFTGLTMEQVQETFDAEPVIVVNPIHISAGRVGGSQEDQRSKWRVACDSMTRRIEYLVAQSSSCCGFLRCDMPVCPHQPCVLVQCIRIHYICEALFLHLFVVVYTVCQRYDIQISQGGLIGPSVPNRTRLVASMHAG